MLVHSGRSPAEPELRTPLNLRPSHPRWSSAEFLYLLNLRVCKMSNPSLGIAEKIQSASIKRNPSPTPDVNPSTAAPRKEPVEPEPEPEPEPSDTASIPSDIVDPSRVVRPAARRPHLPPLPDLRFEQSYLASLEGAESWQRIAWITVRDQVRSALSLVNRISSLAPIELTDVPRFCCPLYRARYGPSPSPAGDTGTVMLSSMATRLAAGYADGGMK